MTPDEFKKFQNTAAGRLPSNAHLFMGPVEADRAKPAAPRPLDHGPAVHESCPQGLEVDIILIALRRCLLDHHDAVAYACKPLTDAIAADLGVPDNDPRLHWQYHQLPIGPRKAEGVMVYIFCTASYEHPRSL